MEWNRKNFLRLVILLVLGFGVGGVLYVNQDAGGSFTFYRVKGWTKKKLGGGSVSVTSAERKMAVTKAEELVKKVSAKYPVLKIEPKSVPDDENGFLAYLMIQNDPRLAALGRLKLHEKIDHAVIPVDEIYEELKSHESIIEEIRKMAAMPGRSSENLPIPSDGFISATEVRSMVLYLLFEARAAAAKKNEQKAYEHVSLALNLGEHFRETESVTLIMETATIVVRQTVRDQLIKYILPELGRDADLEKWRALLKPRTDGVERFAHLIRGEFDHFQRQWLAMIVLSHFEYDMPDPESFFEAYAAYAEANIKALRAMSFPDFAKKSFLPMSSYTEHLSKEAVEVFSVLYSGVYSWKKGYIRQYIHEIQFDAALDLLVREKAGEDLSKLSETHVLNPLDGKPFGYDPVKRVVSEVTGVGGLDLPELKLPW